MTIGVLALQGASARHLEMFERLGVPAVEVRSVGELAGVQALVLPGGESTTIGKLLASTGLEGPLRARLAEGMPAFGTCAGMILLATGILDGRPDQRPLAAIDIDVRRNAFGRQIDSFEADLDVAGVPGGPVHAVFIRAPVVERAGPGVEVLARLDGRPVVCRERSVLVSSFHPELGRDTRLHELFVDVVASKR